MGENDSRESKARRAFLICIAAGVVFGIVFGFVGERALGDFDLWGGEDNEPLAVPYMLFVAPALSFTPWYIHDVPILRQSLSGMFWGSLAFLPWWLFRLRKNG